jgi:hypothetical protein
VNLDVNSLLIGSSRLDGTEAAGEAYIVYGGAAE